MIHQATEIQHNQTAHQPAIAAAHAPIASKTVLAAANGTRSPSPQAQKGI
jgi:hypothetical protein